MTISEAARRVAEFRHDYRSSNYSEDPADREFWADPQAAIVQHDIATLIGPIPWDSDARQTFIDNFRFHATRLEEVGKAAAL